MRVQLFEGTTPSPDLFKPVENKDIKPYGGMWTSTFIRRPYWSEWIQWCLNEAFKGPEFDLHLLYPKQDVKILTIDTLEKLKSLPGYEFYSMKYVDYEKIAQNYDGLRLTQEFINNFRLSLCIWMIII